jgi:uncharacterized protein YndB with AHSA1/START domain
MAVIEFELRRVIRAPIELVFERLADFGDYSDWMPRKGSIFRGTEQTSPGEPEFGTTYLDQTSVGPTPGEIVEFERPTRLVYHWWDRGRSGRMSVEGWPGYTLAVQDDGTTLVRHSARMHVYGKRRLATPLYRRIAVRERTATIDALQASFR